MRSNIIIAGLLAFIGSCQAIDAVEAAKILYFYAVYDFDSRMWGTGYVTPNCQGTRDDGKCTFDEFVNFICSGTASSSPSYYEITSGFSFYPGDIMAIISALMPISNIIHEAMHNRVVAGRSTSQGIFDDLAIIVDENHRRANLRQVGASRHMHNIMESLGGLKLHLTARREGNLAARVRSWNENVNWRIVTRESEYVRDRWQMVDWKETVRANPDMMNPKSTLYQNVVKRLKGEANLAENLQEQTIASKVVDTLNQCRGV